LFFAAFDCLESVGEAARELGLHALECCRWMVEAGINPRRRGFERRAEFDRLRAAGTSRTDAARHVGVHIRTAIEWDNGMRRSNGLRLDHDGRIVGYNKNVTTLKSRRAGLAAVDQQLDPCYLLLAEKDGRGDLTATGESIEFIAGAPQRSPSTIGWELRQNCPNTGTHVGSEGTTRRRRARFR